MLTPGIPLLPIIFYNAVTTQNSLDIYLQLKLWSRGLQIINPFATALKLEYTKLDNFKYIKVHNFKITRKNNL